MCWQLPRCAGQVSHVSIEQSAAVSDEQGGPIVARIWLDYTIQHLYLNRRVARKFAHWREL